MKNLVFISCLFFILSCNKEDTSTVDVTNCTASKNCKLESFKPPMSIDEAKTTITYNPDGSIKQVIEINEGDLGLDTIIIDHTYYPNYFVRTYTKFSTESRDTFYFDNSGKITKVVEDGLYTLYEYNSSNQLVKSSGYFTFSNEPTESSEYVWEGDKIVKINSGGITSTIEYYDEVGSHPIYNFHDAGSIYNYGVPVKYLLKKISDVPFFGDLASIEIRNYVKDGKCNVISSEVKWTILGQASPYVKEIYTWECL